MTNKLAEIMKGVKRRQEHLQYQYEEYGRIVVYDSKQSMLDIEHLLSIIENTKKENKEMIATLKAAYLKHGCGDDSIGWEELSEKLMNTLCNVIGDDEFCKLCKEVK